MMPGFDPPAFGQQHALLAERAVRAEQRLRDIEARHADAVRRAQEHQVALQDVAPKVDEVLAEVQRRVNEAVVGSMSDLLTKLVQHVMDDDTRRIVCENDLDGRGQASIRFFMEREDGAREDILSGNGGSVANVISAGLRLIAVHRSPTMRKLLVLDEPDCWLAPDRVGPFVQILHKAALQCGDMQALLITHHDLDAALLADVGWVRLERTAGGLRAISRVARPAQGKAIARVRLQNWRSHHDTVIDLGMGLTVISGVNNLGKSAFVEALRALCYGGARADVISHGQRQAKVTVHLADGRSIEVERNKTSPVHVRRLLAQDGSVMNEDFGAGRETSLPPWHDEAVGVRAVDGIEVHVADQKRPVFLLDLPATQQVALLSIGQEAQRMSDILQRWREMRRQWQTQLRLAQQEAERLRRLMQSCPAVNDIAQARQALADLAHGIQQSQQRAAQKQATLQQLLRLRPVERLNAPACPALPQPLDLHERAGALLRLMKAQPCAALRPLGGLVLPDLDASRLRERLQALSSAVRMDAAAKRLKGALPAGGFAAPVLPDTPVLQARSQSLAAVQEAMSEGKVLSAQAREWEKQIHELCREKEAIESALGVCPVCERAFAADCVHA